MKVFKFALIAAVLFAGVVSTFAEDATDVADIDEEEEEVPQHILTDIPPPHDDLEFSFIFPDYLSNNFQGGDNVDVVVGLYNKGEETFNITNVAGSLNAPFQFSYFIQNYTISEYDLLLGPDERATIGYTFKPDALLEPEIEFTLALTAFYNDNDENYYGTTFFNSTITTFEKPIEFDSQQFFTYVGGAGVALLVFLLFSNSMSSGTKSKKSSGKHRGGDEWVIKSKAGSPAGAKVRGKKA
eukprot:GFYU01000619.1.p1 GENE.GFYU01000619.1~~GFYU01000619.1.p1  ORF type:complete len:262 (+),score=106.55 GFYU01000619.1:66-788(+)